MMTFPSTPKSDGFRMPGEFEPHSMCWMLWPERPDVWRNGAKPAQKVWVAIASAIAEFEPVTMVSSATQYRNARRMLPDHIRVIECSNNDSWIRDSGPTFVVNDQGEVRGIDWNFNAYGGLDGGLYYPWDSDDLIARKLLEVASVGRYDAPLTLEGGAIHVDGQGTLITTTDCLLNANRNPNLSRSEIEHRLKEYLNLEQIIWLDNNIGDETDGHVDGLCCFARPGEVILGWTDDQENPNHDIVREAHAVLSRTTDAQGRALTIHKLPFPNPMYLTEKEAEGIEFNEFAFPREIGMPIADSYVNFYMPNKGIVMPEYGQPADTEAREILRAIFPERRVVSIPSREVAIGGGIIHCITQQQPTG